MRCFNKFSKDVLLIDFLIAGWYSVWRKVAQVKQDLKCNPLPAIVNIFWSAIVSTCICICVFNIKRLVSCHPSKCPQNDPGGWDSVFKLQTRVEGYNT